MPDREDSEAFGSPKFDVDISGGDVGIIGDYGTVNKATPRRKIVWPVAVGSPPPLASAFQPRPGILEQLDQATSTVVLRQVMAGDGGVGKSQIAAGVYESSEAGLRVWVAAESRAAVITGYAEAARRLDLADAEEGPEQLARSFLGFLAGTDKRCLVVLDDLTDPKDMAGLWPAGQARVIVTTRRRDAALTGGGRTMIDVGVYTVEEAEAYLSQRLGPLQDQLPGGALEQARDLAADLGYLPLGLAQAAAVIIDQAISCTEYREWFADRAGSLADLFPPQADADGYAKTVATTWALAIEAANQLPPMGLAEPMARLVAVLDPTGAPEAVYTSQPARSYLAKVTEHEDVSVASARGALRALHRLSVITHDPDTSEPRAVRMHNLTGRAVLQTVEAEAGVMLVRVAADALRESWPDSETSPVLAEALRANTATLSTVWLDALLYRGTGTHPVLFRSGRSLAALGLASEAIAYFSELRDQTERILGPDHPDTLISCNELARAYESAGDLERAIPLFEQNLTDFERVLGPDKANTLASRNELARAYESAGDLERATPLFEQNLTDAERILDPDHPDTLTYRSNLAHTYHSAGDLGRAIPLLERTLQDRERILGPHHPKTLISRDSLASAYLSSGDFERAIPLFEQNLTDAERILGPDHPNTLMFENNLAHAYQAGGDLVQAIPLFEQNLTDAERILGPDHPNTLSSRNNLAHAYQAGGDLVQAIRLFELTLQHRERILSPSHPHTLISRNNLAGAYESAGDPELAIQLFEQNLTDAERILGPDHPRTLMFGNNLAGAYLSGRALGRAIPLYERILKDRERILGSDHPHTLISRINLASAYQAASQVDEAAGVRSDSQPENGDHSPAR